MPIITVKDVTPGEEQDFTAVEPQYEGDQQYEGEYYDDSQQYDSQQYDSQPYDDQYYDDDSYEEEEEDTLATEPQPKQISDLTLHIPGITLFYGMTNSGKSVLMKHLLYLCARQFEQIYVFQGSVNNDWKSCLPANHVFMINEATESKLKIIMNGAERLSKSKQKSHTLIIFDDPFNGGTKYHQSKIWNTLSSMGRHSLISVWMSVQNPGHIPPILKGNIAGCFITKLSESHIKKIYEYTHGFSRVGDLVSYLKDNIDRKGKVFYNDIGDAFGRNPYMIIDVPYPPPQFMISFR